VLLHLAKENGAQRIVQIAYYRPSKWPQILIDGGNKVIPNEVLQHFRDVSNIVNMVSNPNIEIFNLILKNRRSYFPEVQKAVEKYRNERKIIFLDPDTGLAPTNATLKHVLPSELKDIWQEMQRGDLLVFYQHKTNRNNEPWVEEKRIQFVAALGIADGAVKIAYGPDIASDVVFFYCRKDDG
jgi:hypothetical protein